MASFPARFVSQLNGITSRQNNPVFINPTAAGMRNPFFTDFILNGASLEESQIEQVRSAARVTRKNAIRMCDRILEVCDQHMDTIRQRSQQRQIEHVQSDPALQVQLLQQYIESQGLANPLNTQILQQPLLLSAPGPSNRPSQLYPSEPLDDNFTDYQYPAEQLDVSPPRTPAPTPAPVPAPAPARTPTPLPPPTRAAPATPAAAPATTVATPVVIAATPVASATPPSTSSSSKRRRSEDSGDKKEKKRPKGKGKAAEEDDIFGGLSDN